MLSAVCLTLGQFVNNVPPMEMPQLEGLVLPEWIDANGHLNLAYYVVLFDQATDLLYDALGIGQAYREATGNSTFTAETHTLYEREVRVGERVRVVPYLLGADTKRSTGDEELVQLAEVLRDYPGTTIEWLPTEMIGATEPERLARLAKAATPAAIPAK